MIKKIITSFSLLAIGILSAFICFGTAYVVSRPEKFIEIPATIDQVSLEKFTAVRGKYFIKIQYHYEYKNKKYLGGDHHYLPQKFYAVDYSNVELQKYISDWKQDHIIGSKIKIVIHPWRPDTSGFASANMTATFVLFAVVIWFLSIFLFVLILIITQIYSNRRIK